MFKEEDILNFSCSDSERNFCNFDNIMHDFRTLREFKEELIMKTIIKLLCLGNIEFKVKVEIECIHNLQ